MEAKKIKRSAISRWREKVLSSGQIDLEMDHKGKSKR
jgi:hypothetical protein